MGTPAVDAPDRRCRAVIPVSLGSALDPGADAAAAGAAEVFFDWAAGGADGVRLGCGGFGKDAVFFVPGGGGVDVCGGGVVRADPVEAAGTFNGSLQAGQRISFPAY